MSNSSICLKASFIIWYYINIEKFHEQIHLEFPGGCSATFNKKFLFQCVILSTLSPICKDSCGAKCFSVYYWFAMALWLRGFRIVEINWSVWYRFTLDKNYHTPFHSWYSLHYILIYFAWSSATFSNLFGQQQNPDDLSSMGKPTRDFSQQTSQLIPPM